MISIPTTSITINIKYKLTNKEKERKKTKMNDLVNPLIDYEDDTTEEEDDQGAVGNNSESESDSDSDSDESDEMSDRTQVGGDKTNVNRPKKSRKDKSVILDFEFGKYSWCCPLL